MPLKKNRPWNVLVFPAASEVGLEINRALGACKEVVLHGAGQRGPSVASTHFRNLHELPTIHHSDCLPEIQKLIATHSIDAIFPAYDDVVVWLAEHAAHLKATILAPDISVCNLCRSKRATYAAFKNILPTPRVWQPDAHDIAFPVFVKPDKGQGSQRARRIDSADALKRALAAEPDLIIMENLAGVEFTVDCFSQRGRGVLFAGARRRVQTKTGISTISEAVELPLAKEWADKIQQNLAIHGTWFFQMKADSKGKYRLLEVAPRIAGSMALSRVLGPNFPLLSLFEAAEIPVTLSPIHSPISISRSLDIRFTHNMKIDALYVDLDDTLVLRNQVNTQLIALMFQYRNQGIPVHLITRHKRDLGETLSTFRLNGLFDKIIHIKDDATRKSDFIPEMNAVLIDDSFAERQAASATGHITCFDAAASVCLIDERA
jgi:hypothetical protein